MTIETIFARPSGGKNEPETAALAPTIQQTVAAVRHPAPLKLALQTWQVLQRSYAAASEELRQAIFEMREAGGETAAAAAPLARRVTELDRRLRGCATIRDPLRPAPTAAPIAPRCLSTLQAISELPRPARPFSCTAAAARR
jgi:hypothetical protein